MQIRVKLIQLPPIQTSTSKNGEWEKQDVILETDSQYPKKSMYSNLGR